MSNLNIYPFQVEDLTSGKMKISGRKNTSFLNKITSHKIFYQNLNERRRIEGTPTQINHPILKNHCHLGKSFLKIVKSVGEISNTSVYIPDRLRITLIGGHSGAKNTILYTFLNKNEITSDTKWRVLFANCKSQSIGDFIDIDLPDENNLYLGLAIINKGWDYKRILNSSEKICNLKNTLDYFTINPSYSKNDINLSHSIHHLGYNNHEGLMTRYLITFEDWHFDFSDRDYNDVILSISSVFFDENEINDL